MNTPISLQMTHLHIPPDEWQRFVATVNTIHDLLEKSTPPQKPATRTNTIAQQFYTRKEAAKILRVSVPTLCKYIAAGRVESRRIDRRVLIPVESIENFGMTKK